MWVLDTKEQSIYQRLKMLLKWVCALDIEIEREYTFVSILLCFINTGVIC